MEDSSSGVSIHPTDHSSTPTPSTRKDLEDFRDHGDGFLSDFFEQQRAFYMRTYASAVSGNRTPDKTSSLSKEEASRGQAEQDNAQYHDDCNLLANERQEGFLQEFSAVSSPYNHALGSSFTTQDTQYAPRPPVARPLHLPDNSSSSSYPFLSSSFSPPPSQDPPPSSTGDSACKDRGSPGDLCTPAPASIFAPREPFERILSSSSSSTSASCPASLLSDSPQHASEGEEESEEEEEEEAVLSSAAIREQLRLQLVAARYVQQGMVPPVEILAQIEALLPRKEKKKRLASVRSTTAGGRRREVFTLPLLSQLRKKIREGTRQEAFAQLEERQRLLKYVYSPHLSPGCRLCLACLEKTSS